NDLRGEGDHEPLIRRFAAPSPRRGGEKDTRYAKPFGLSSIPVARSITAAAKIGCSTCTITGFGGRAARLVSVFASTSASTPSICVSGMSIGFFVLINTRLFVTNSDPV